MQGYDIKSVTLGLFGVANGGGKFLSCWLVKGNGWCGEVDHGVLSLIDNVEICRDTVVSFSKQPLSVDVCRNEPCRNQIMLITYQYIRWGRLM